MRLFVTARPLMKLSVNWSDRSQWFHGPGYSLCRQIIINDSSSRNACILQMGGKRLDRPNVFHQAQGVVTDDRYRY